MKYIALIVVTIILFNGCCCGPEEKYYNSAQINNVLIDSNDTIHIMVNETFNDKKHCLKQSIDKSWIYTNMKNCTNLISNENIKYNSNNIKITDISNSIIFEDILPTISEIENTSGISLPNSNFKYMPMKKVDYNKWDRKTNILVVGVNKEIDKYGSNYYSNIYYFSVIKKDDNWLINKIYETNKINSDIGLTNDNLYINFEHIYGSFNFNSIFSVGSREILGYLPFNSTGDNIIPIDDYKVFVKIDNEITVKKVFGDIYPEVFSEKISDVIYTKYSTTYFFDNDNIHIFYNEDSANGDYFNYISYSKENPSTPLYEQKIYWKE
ncbi:MAG TPA: hypothetical protein ENK67_08375 [Flavobacteriia bacterium]|nr:hypothetical protein [Flavobacteriia bacterium]